MIEFLCEKWKIFMWKMNDFHFVGKKTKDFIFLKKIVCTINNSDEIKSQINIQWIGSESKPDKRKISEKNEKLCKTTVNYTLNIQAIIQIQWNCVRIFFFLQKCEYSKEIKIIRLFIRRNVLCRMKKKMNKMSTLPFASYTVFKSILNEPTTVPDRRNFREWSTYGWKKRKRDKQKKMANFPY